MNRRLCPDFSTARLEPYELPNTEIRSGTPQASALELDRLGPTAIGLWELTEGTVVDTEVDEVFVVLSGAGWITWEDGDSMELGPGVIVRLRAGERTTWTIRATLRKVYIALD
ncbi:MAG TPA: cupin domain-containing protein [Marmoricola sp.]|nr:cupin domain-containing protein [Marmoricola sp.]